LFEQRRKRRKRSEEEEEEAAHSAIPLLSERTGYYCGAGVWTEEAKEGAVVVTRMFIENAAELVSYRNVTYVGVAAAAAACVLPTMCRPDLT
jgi:hypothetical protein